MFLNNEATRQYFKIIEEARANPPPKDFRQTMKGQYEKHHIVPTSFWKSLSKFGVTEKDAKCWLNEKCNTVVMLARDHFRCHMLLLQMLVQESEEYECMLYAIRGMANGRHKDDYNITSEEYERAQVVSSIITSKNNLKRFADGTHPFLDTKKQSERVQKRVEDGTHHFLGGDLQMKRIEEGTHPFVNSSWQREQSNKGNKSRWSKLTTQEERRKHADLRWARYRRANGKQPKPGDEELLREK